MAFGLALTALAACGGTPRVDRYDGGFSRTVSASGPINTACLSSDRRARSSALCGCIQAVANQTLSRADQRKAAGFFRDPHQAQEIRQSDRPSDEAFWKRYRAYGNRAEAICA